MSWESLRRPAPVSDPPGLPEFRLEKQGRIVGPAHGRMVLVTDLATGVLALLPVCGQAVEDFVVVARLDRYLPMSGHVVTAVDLVVLALARCLGVSGCGLMTAAVLAGTALNVTGLGLLPAVGLGGSVRVPMFVGEVAVTARSQAIPIATLMPACDHESGHFCPLSACGQWREDNEPGVSNRRVWRRWLYRRLLLSLDRLLQWLLFL